MMSIEAIVALNDEIAEQAALDSLTPFVPFSSGDVERWPPFPFANLGHYEPDGWEKTEDNWFVDKTGHGRESEPALTIDSFKRQLRAFITSNPGYGFAITEEGPFQVVISAFRRVESE